MSGGAVRQEKTRSFLVVFAPWSYEKLSSLNRKSIETVGVRVAYLPLYSPDFNSIEMAFAKLKAILRSMAARTVTNLWAALPLQTVVISCGRQVGGSPW
ncbi:hypothetical protein CH337_09530 [Rhodoblastus acidophilus]|nr:hypothetical protein CKO16_09300 [Rhodoblastus acidophilus]RAI20448.1 hypothetical protein CH337_09530 [Rhodoblastus acidophilus]